MFIKSLRIYTPQQEIRNIQFHKGLNLIVDETAGGQETGNNVGKTTVLRLIDFCLGKDCASVYVDPENKRLANEEVKNFLIDNDVHVELILTDANEENSVVICRNFLARTKAVRTINGIQFTDQEFETELGKAILGLNVQKPTFRQVISHNLRIEDFRLANTMKTLDPYTSNLEYEILYLYMFGCHVESAEERQNLLKNLETQTKFKRKLEGRQGKGAYQAKLGIVNSEIEKLEKERESLHLNPDFEVDMEQHAQLKMKMNAMSSEINSLRIRKNVIEEALTDYQSQRSDMDMKQLAQIYKQANALMPEVQHTFEEMVAYHNSMLEQKSDFLSSELPTIEKRIEELSSELGSLIMEEREVGIRLQKTSTYADLEDLISRTNEQYRQKGELEKIIQQIQEAEEEINTINANILQSGAEIFSADFQNLVQRRVNEFNRFFSEISTELYNEQYAVKCDVEEIKGNKVYKFSTFNANFSTGKKQGEITCFDLAYTMFADSVGIPCLHFLLSDKKELVHDNQLSRIAKLVNAAGNVQFVASILKDKLPQDLNCDNYFIVKLKQDNKLFGF
jgi:uncharacterized protein YydD (DUF2326 family)